MNYLLIYGGVMLLGVAAYIQFSTITTGLALLGITAAIHGMMLSVPEWLR